MGGTSNESGNIISAPIPEGAEASAQFSAMNFHRGGTNVAIASENDPTGPNLTQIEEDDVSMASYNSETQPMQSE
jgi:hypothetical protein